MRALGYLRVSTSDQATDGHSLDHQRHAIAGEVTRRGWTLADWAHDETSASTIRRRPGFELALERLDIGDYDALVVSRLDRAWRSVGDFAATMDRAQRNGWLIVMLDPAVDMATPFGRAMAGVAAVFAQLERELLSQRTSEGIRAGYASGRIQPPQPKVSQKAVQRICELSSRGLSHRKIAAQLTVEGVESVRGGPWPASTVGLVLKRLGQAAVLVDPDQQDQQRSDDADDRGKPDRDTDRVGDRGDQNGDQDPDHALTRHL
jgi:DNA invertase Pin-like site-specific DNA recombinase